jgi:hypothetical protein
MSAHVAPHLRPKPELFTVAIVDDDGNVHHLPGHHECDDVIEALASYAEKGLVITNNRMNVEDGFFWLPVHRIKRAVVVRVAAEKEGA